jgi:hypothetical protein
LSATAYSASYEETIAKWTSYEDVANWMKKEFLYDYGRNVMSHGWNPRTPQETFRLKSGVCYDGANFARDALNRINPDYQARIVFIKNSDGPPHHWVTSFRVDGKLYIIDYAAGRRWAQIMGVHGPYNSLDDYAKFLSSLRMPKFTFQTVKETDK